ncbi:hypothetical protein [Mycolicibacterium sp. HS_4_1]
MLNRLVAVADVVIGVPNSMYHLDGNGNGTKPSGPASGKIGVIGQYGRPSRPANGPTLATIGYRR